MCELELNALCDSSYSNNPLFSCLQNNSDSDDMTTDSDCTTLENKTPKKRKVRHGTFNVVDFNGRKIKAKHRCSAWFMLCVENPDVNDATFLKDFRRRFRLPCFSYK